jgi:hypothetical protein
MEKLNITQGEWLIGENSNSVEIETNLTDRGRMQLFYCVNVPANQRKDNAVLIADAGTTYNTTPILPSELLKQRNELLEALQDIIKTANPTNVSSNKTFMGMDLGELYVGRCGIPSNKSIHMAINAIKNATNA